MSDELAELCERLRRYKLSSGYAWYTHKAANEIESLRTKVTELEEAVRQQKERNAIMKSNCSEELAERTDLCRRLLGIVHHIRREDLLAMDGALETMKEAEEILV